MTEKTSNIFAVENCSFHYPGGAQLKNLQMTFSPGRMYGLIGPNGSGKTTLIDLLIGAKKPDSGRIIFRGKEVGEYAKSALARDIALVPQNFSMEFEFSVFDVVMMGRHPYIPRFANPRQQDIDQVDAALALLDISHLRNRLIPHLSGGERQRVIVARAIAQNTAVMILDEATASLDIRHSIDIMTALRQKVDREQATVVAAIHDLEMAAAFCDELIVLQSGRIHTAGPVERVLTSELLTDVFHVQAEIELRLPKPPRIRYSYLQALQN